MELSLKAARKLEQKINKLLKESTLKTTVKVRSSSDYIEARNVIKNAQDVLDKEIQLRLKLTEIVGEIRNKISAKNESCGLSTLLSGKATLEKLIAEYNSILEAEETPTPQLLEDMLSVAKANMTKDSDYGRGNRLQVDVSIVPKNVYQSTKDLRENAKVEIEKIEDKVAELNFTQKIKLEDDTTALLVQGNLVK